MLSNHVTMISTTQFRSNNHVTIIWMRKFRLKSTGCRMLPWSIRTGTVAFPAESSVNKSRHTRLHPKRATVWDLWRFHLSVKLKAQIKITFWSDMKNYLPLQSSWRWPPWRGGSPQDGCARLGRWPWWQPLKIPSLIIWSFKRRKFFCILWNLFEMKHSDEFYIKKLILN